MENINDKDLIDCLPYIDKAPNQNEMEQIEKMIMEEVNKLKKEKEKENNIMDKNSEDNNIVKVEEKNKNQKGKKKNQKGKKSEQIENKKENKEVEEKEESKELKLNIRDKEPKRIFDIPSISKKYDIKLWENLLSEIDEEIEFTDMNNFDLEKVKKKEIEFWDTYIDNLNKIYQGLVNEKSTLTNDITFLNKKRKFNQINYDKELKEIEKKIKEERELISDLEDKIRK